MLEKSGCISRKRLESNERKLYIQLTEKGRALKLEAERIPCAVRNSIPLEDAEMALLHKLLNKALARMHPIEE